MIWLVIDYYLDVHYVVHLLDDGFVVHFAVWSISVDHPQKD
jgi:hypothetical protein